MVFKIIFAGLLICSCISVASAGIEFREECWILQSVSGDEKSLNSSVISDKKEHILKVKIDKDVKDKLSTEIVDKFERCPVTIYQKSYVQNETYKSEYDEVLTMIDSYEIDVKNSDKEIKLKSYKNMDDMVMKIGSNTIVYAGAANTITATPSAGFGDSWANAVCFNDIYLADQAGGWNEITKLTPNSFSFQCTLILGTTGNGLIFQDSEGSVEFLNNERMYVTEGDFKIGKLINESLHITGEGFKFFTNFNTNTHYIEFKNCNLTLYDTIFTQQTAGFGQIRINHRSTENVSLIDVQINDFRQVNADIYTDFPLDMFRNVNIRSLYYGIVIHPVSISLGSYNDITFYDCDTGILFNFADTDLEFWNCNIYESVLFDMDLVFAQGDYYFIDCDMDWNIKHLSMSFYVWKIYRQYTFNLKTNVGATVTISDNTSQIWTGTVGSNGTIPQQRLTHGTWVQESDTTLDESNEAKKNPFTLKIEKSGNETYNHTFNIHEPMKWEIQLQPECGAAPTPTPTPTPTPSPTATGTPCPGGDTTRQTFGFIPELFMAMAMILIVGAYIFNRRET